MSPPNIILLLYFDATRKRTIEKAFNCHGHLNHGPVWEHSLNRRDSNAAKTNFIIYLWHKEIVWWIYILGKQKYEQ